MARALELVGDHGGRYDSAAVARSMSDEGSSEHRSGAAGAWREAFLRMPYWRDPAVGLGVIMDTFESAVTWDRFENFYRNVKQDVGRAVRHSTGQEIQISCRFTHLYPDGPAPYFTLVTRAADGNVAGALAAWREIKQAANAAVVAHGGTITHHHAVGRDHRSGYEREVDPLFRQMLAAAKQVADPRGILNPGVLFDPENRAIGRTGALAGARPSG
jgi:alkyldihydroxyacetonephosphate synthase